MRIIGCLLIAAVLLLARLRADEAVRKDGHITSGTLRLEKTGELLFTPSTGKEALSANEMSEVRFPAGATPIFRGAPGHVLHLRGDQQITGVFLGMEKNNLLMRTAFSDRLAVPRDAATALTQLPGFQPVVVDDFQGKLSAWSVRGEPAKGDGAIVLAKADQALTHMLTSPLPAGRIGVSFRENGPVRGGRWLLEATFTHKTGERVLRVGVAGEKNLSVDSGGIAGMQQRVGRVDGWRQLRIDFSAGSVRITCDENVLWFTLTQGPRGSLKQVRLACVAPKPEELRGSTAFTDFVVERATPQHRRPPGDPGQDELWLAGGDQVFGEVVRADRAAVEIKGRYGVRRFAWTGLRGWFLKQTTPRAKGDTVGQEVRLSLHSGLRPALDVLEGTVKSLDARTIVLRHRVLGELSLPRSSVSRLQPLVEEP